MPLRDLSCDTCCTVEEDVLCYSISDELCPHCGEFRTRIFTPAAMIGPTERRPLDLAKAAGMHFTSNKAVRDYFRNHPEAKLVTKGDSVYQGMYTRVREANEKAAKALGYRDRDHHARATPAEKAERRAAIEKPTT